MLDANDLVLHFSEMSCLVLVSLVIHVNEMSCLVLDLVSL